MTLDEEIAWWTQWISRTDELGFLAFGVVTGLKIAKADFGAKQKRYRDTIPAEAFHEETT